MKTSELIGAQLDWAVANCEGMVCTIWRGVVLDQFNNPVMYSDDWSQAGPIIEREGMGMWMYQWNEEGDPEVGWYAEDKDGNHVRTGPTPLIAAMRCYVASKAVELDLPEELK